MPMFGHSGARSYCTAHSQKKQVYITNTRHHVVDARDSLQPHTHTHNTTGRYAAAKFSDDISIDVGCDECDVSTASYRCVGFAER